MLFGSGLEQDRRRSEAKLAGGHSKMCSARCVDGWVRRVRACGGCQPVTCAAVQRCSGVGCQRKGRSAGTRAKNGWGNLALMGHGRWGVCFPRSLIIRLSLSAACLETHGPHSVRVRSTEYVIPTRVHVYRNYSQTGEAAARDSA